MSPCIHHEGGGGDNFEATFMSMTAYVNGGTVGPANGTYSAFTGKLIASYVPRCFSMTFAQQPSNGDRSSRRPRDLYRRGRHRLARAPSATKTTRVNEWNNYVVYQWTKNGVPIAGANGSSYSFGPVSPLDSSITVRLHDSGTGLCGQQRQSPLGNQQHRERCGDRHRRVRARVRPPRILLAA